MKDLSKISRKELVLLRTVNRCDSKENQMQDFDQYYSNEQLADYIEHFHDPQPDFDEEAYWDELAMEEAKERSCTARDYGPSNPWDAPGMSIHDFI
jgi:hypothetical protein